MSFMESSQDDLTPEGQAGVSRTGGEQSSSESASASESPLAEMEERVKRLEGTMKSLQSGKDRGINKATKIAKKAQSRTEELSEEIGKMQRYLEEYGSIEQAARALAIDELLLEPAQGITTSEVSPEVGSADQEPETEVSVDEELLTYMGIDPHDPGYVKRIQEGEDPLEAAKAIAREKAGVGTQEAQTEITTTAGVMPTGGGVGGSQATTAQAVLKKQYDQELQQIRRGDVNAIHQLKDKYRRKGLNIW